MFGHQQGLPQQNWGYQYPIAPAQYGAGNYTPRFGQGLNLFRPATNSTWRPMPQTVGGQGYAAPGYPPRFPRFQQPQPQMPMTQGYPTQSLPPQNYAPQGYNQGYGGQKPLQPAWEEPKKGGIKGFISNLMAKRKR